ncbi:hypothetical protein D3C76_1113600 [compost metagenome]
MRFFLQVLENHLAGFIASANVLQAGVFGRKTLANLFGILGVVVPGTFMKTSGAQQGCSISGNVVE